MRKGGWTALLLPCQGEQIGMEMLLKKTPCKLIVVIPLGIMTKSHEDCKTRGQCDKRTMGPDDNRTKG